MRRSTWLGLVGLLLVALGIALGLLSSRLAPTRAVITCLGAGLAALALVRRFRDDE